MAFNPSPQQSDFYEWVENGYGSCILSAVAGSGKTTTLVNGLTKMPGYVFFGAFNKKISEEIKLKVQNLGLEKLTVGTMHSEGFKIWRRAAKGVRVDSNKCRNIFRAGVEKISETDKDQAEELRQLESQILKLVSMAKQVGVGLMRTDRSVWYEIIDRHDIDCNEKDDLAVKAAIGLLKRSIAEDHDVVDFDDMIYAPLIHGCRPFRYDWVLIDEAQDTNATRRALALLILKPGGRLIAVGDPHQAIYGFTGADSDALDLIARDVSAKWLPLSVTYRCPKKVVEHAHQWVNHITAHETAPDGVVRTLEADKDIVDEAKIGDAILCRFNAPLLNLVYKFIAKGKPAKIEGREIGNGLKQLARRWKVKGIDALRNKLENYCEKEKEKFILKDQESRAQAIEDKVNCLYVIIERVLTTKVDEDLDAPTRVCNEIDRIFDDNVSGRCIVLSTIHKSKGREWLRVFWLLTGPSKWAKQNWEKEQENNLCYVATTRAMAELILFSEALPQSANDRKVEETEKVEVKS